MPRNESATLRTRLNWLMLGRLALLSSLLAASIFLSSRTHPAGDIFHYLYALIGFLFAVSAVYLLLMRASKRLEWIARTQIQVDVLFVTALVFFTGGVTSLFPFLYILVIISGGVLLGRRTAFLCAGESCVLYGAIANFQFYGILTPPYLQSLPPVLTPEGVLVNLLTHFSAFFLVAFLISHLSAQLSRAEKALQEQRDDVVKLEALNEWILESIESGLFTVDRSGRILSWNSAAERILGFSADEVREYPLEKIFPDFARHLAEAGKDGDGADRRREVCLRRKDGKEVFLGFSVSRLLDPGGKQYGVTVIFQDITEIKQYQEKVKRLERLAVLGKLAAGMAHEIRNPLGSISGALQMLREDPGDPDLVRRLMSIVDREMSRLTALLNEYLLLSRTRKAPKERKKIDPVPIVEETLTLLETKLDEGADLRFIREIEPGCPLPLAEDHFRQLLWNLLLNAAESSGYRGEIRIAVFREGKEGEEETNGWIVFEVEDHGEGMDPEVREHIFEPFFTTRSTGTGLGLTVVQVLVENYGGSVEVESEKGEGTTFRIRLPLAETTSDSSESRTTA